MFVAITGVFFLWLDVDNVRYSIDVNRLITLVIIIVNEIYFIKSALFTVTYIRPLDCVSSGAFALLASLYFTNFIWFYNKRLGQAISLTQTIDIEPHFSRKEKTPTLILDKSTERAL